MPPNTRRIDVPATAAAILFLAFVVAANVIVGEEGPDSTKYVAFLLVGPVLTLRDFLHRRWEVDDFQLWLRILGIVIAGAALSYVFALDNGDVPIASAVAFTVATLLDTYVFSRLRNDSLSIRVLVSNLFSGLADTFLFFWIAFGDPITEASYVQWLAKMAGGAVWLVLWHYVYPERRDR
jgi:uncharacterized PurR-regulated membrane protein YhhQ (DUF165 family)